VQQGASAAKDASQAPTQGGESNVMMDMMNQFSGYGSPSAVEVGQ
jgi:hypothetical protein